MARMKRILLLLLASCSAPSPAPAPRPARAPTQRTDGAAFTGDPDAAARAVCDALGVTHVDGILIDHYLYDPKTENVYGPWNPNQIERSLFREALPFPQHKWYGGKFEITQLVFPYRDGFVARYQLTNHGDGPEEVRLYVGVRGGGGARRSGRRILDPRRVLLHSFDEPGTQGALKPSEDRPLDVAFSYDLTVDSGASKFVHVGTVDLAGSTPMEALELSAGRWEKRMSSPRLGAPDPGFVTTYYLDLAGSILGVAGCPQAVLRAHDRMYRPEGEALRLFPGVPDAWLAESFSVENAPTPFGTLTYRFHGGVHRWSLELGGSCRPPGGYLVAVKHKVSVQVDGKDAAAENGLVRIPAGSRRVEVSRE